MYLNSTNIGVFPTSGRPQYDPLGRLTTEYNLTSMLNNLLSVDGFVITDPGAYTETGYDLGSNSITTIKQPFQFNIKGYIFTIHDVNSLIEGANENSYTEIYAHLIIDENIGTTLTKTATEDGNKNVQRITSIHNTDTEQDDGSYKYKGIEFNNSLEDTSDRDQSSNQSHYALKILEKIGSEWYIPEESKIKFKTTTAGNRRDISIDDGILI